MGPRGQGGLKARRRLDRRRPGPGSRGCRGGAPLEREGWCASRPGPRVGGPQGEPLLHTCPCQAWPRSGALPVCDPGDPPSWSGSGPAGSQAAPAAYDAPGLERAGGVDWWGPGGPAVVPEAWAEERQGQAEETWAEAAGPGLGAGQQRHLLGGRVSRGDHGGLWVTLQLSQVCRDRAAQAGQRALRTTTYPRPRALHPSLPIRCDLAPPASPGPHTPVSQLGPHPGAGSPAGPG